MVFKCCRNAAQQEDPQQSIGAIQLHFGRGRKGEREWNRQHSHERQRRPRRTHHTTGLISDERA